MAGRGTRVAEMGKEEQIIIYAGTQCLPREREAVAMDGWMRATGGTLVRRGLRTESIDS